MIVFAAIRIIVASRGDPSRITGLKRGNLSPKGYGNPVLSLRNFLSKCVETIYPASLVDGEIVQAHLKDWDFRIIFGIKEISAIIQRCIMKTLNIGENLKWQRRDTAQRWEGRNDYQGASLVEMMA